METNYSDAQIEDFERLWNASNADVTDADLRAPEHVDLDHATPDYLLREGVARYKQLGAIVALYVHARYGEKLPAPSLEGDTQEGLLPLEGGPPQFEC